jgi:integrase
MRHSHASKLANDPKIPLAYVRDRLGHSDLSTTSRYVHASDAPDDYALTLITA